MSQQNQFKPRGRPRTTNQRSHISREDLRGTHPLHITLRVLDNVPNLRRGPSLKAFRTSIREAKKFGLYVNHFSVQSNHLHMLVETPSNEHLSRGMKSFGSRLAKAINRNSSPKGDYLTIAQQRQGLRRRGSVFQDRFHMNVLKTSVAVRNVLKYILSNRSRHLKRPMEFDFCSSGPIFTHWRSLFGREWTEYLEEGIKFADECRKEFPENYQELQDALSPPRQWLSRYGWLEVA